MNPLPPTSLPAPEQTIVDRLGPCTHPSPLLSRSAIQFVEDSDRILAVERLAQLEPFLQVNHPPPSFEEAGPRKSLHFDPVKVTCGIVTCGGLCPGLNNVIRAIALAASRMYGVRRVIGFHHGYAGLLPDPVIPPSELTPDSVDPIHTRGGSVLGSSRGPQDTSAIVDHLQRLGVDILFTLGGDGTLRGARDLAAEARARGARLSVIGLPKTIDNDIGWIRQSFGFFTAVDEARRVIEAAHNEAHGALNGIGLVKLMGRESGFIAASATLASGEVNFCLVPEVPLTLDGQDGLLARLERRLASRRHAVIVVAEGAGQDLFPAEAAPARDASGNTRLQDIGLLLRDRIASHLRSRGVAHTLRYIDPSYVIRGLAANAVDAQYCLGLGQHAVHAAMAGRTGMVVGHWNGDFTHVPIPLVVERRRRIDPSGELWQRVLDATEAA